MFGLTDEELLENIMTNITYQYALGLTSAEDIPFSERTFGRFRARLNEYQEKTGIDLIRQEEEEIADRFCRLPGISGKKKRMDSLMIDSRGKYMTRLEIIHATVAKALKTLPVEAVPEEMKHYLERDDRNRIIYHQKDEELAPKLQTAINDAFKTQELMKEHGLTELSEYHLLQRMIGDQTTDSKLKDKEDIEPDSLQNPNDPDATCRYKANKHYRGYSGNVVQSYNDDGASIIVKADYEANTYSDTQYMKDYIDSKDDSEEETMITDGAYQSAANDKASAEVGIRHMATSLTGKTADPLVLEFDWDEENQTVITCPMGKKPVRQSVYKNGTTHRLVFDRKDCSKNCPYFDRCHAKEQKRNTSAVTIDTGSIERANQQIRLESEEYKAAARERNAVEGVPSVLRRRYEVDHIPVFGKLRS